MHFFILWLILACGVLLYAWLVGHWFARILMILPCAVVVGVVLWLATGLTPARTDKDAAAIIGWLGGVLAAWPVSGIPIYVRRNREKNASLELSLR